MMMKIFNEILIYNFTNWSICNVLVPAGSTLSTMNPKYISALMLISLGITLTWVKHFDHWFCVSHDEWVDIDMQELLVDVDMILQYIRCWCRCQFRRCEPIYIYIYLHMLISLRIIFIWTKWNIAIAYMCASKEIDGDWYARVGWPDIHLPIYKVLLAGVTIMNRIHLHIYELVV